jgi:hypothetical protein
MTHVYRHPDSKGLGAHHTGPEAPPLDVRPAQPAEAAAAYRAAVESVGPTDEQREKLEAFLSRSMADLDMPHDAQVEVAETAENGHVLVDWTDKHGDARRTSISPEDFAAFFTEV